MRAFLADCQYALHLYFRTPFSSLIIVCALAIGLSFVSSFVSLYVALALRPHPGFEDSGRIVTIGLTDGRNLQQIPAPLVSRIDEEVSSLEAVAGITWTMQQFGPDNEPILLEAVTQGFFGGLRPRLFLGRGFESADHARDAEPAIVLSHSFWEQEFDSDPNVLGTSIAISGRPIFDSTEEVAATQFRIVGVMGAELPGAFSPPEQPISGANPQAWAPFERAIPIFQGSNSNYLPSLSAIGRRIDGASTAAVSSELEGRYGSALGEFNLPPSFRFSAIPGVVRNLNVHRETSRQLQAFLAGSALLALAAACNIGLFLLARAPSRRRELSIRMSVGAPMNRLARQLLREAGVLVAASALLGLAISVWLSTLMKNLAPFRETQWGTVTLLDWRVLVPVGIFLLLVTFAVSLAPILGLKRIGIAAGGLQVATRATLGQRVAITTQLAIAGALSSAALAFSWYLASMIFGNGGYETRDRKVLTFTAPVVVQAAGRSYPAIAVCLNNQFEISRLRNAILAMPEVTAVSLACAVPGSNAPTPSVIPDRLDSNEQFEFRSVPIDENYVDILNLRLMRGRGPSENTADTVLINQTFARQYFGHEDVVGEALPMNMAGDRTLQVIGVLEDLSFEHPNAGIPPMAFPVNGFGGGEWFAVTETELDTGALQQQLQLLIDSGELEIDLREVQSLGDLRKATIAPDRARGYLTIATGLLVVTLTGFGFFGTQGYLVAAGRREYAIRASLGAGPKALGRLVYWRAYLLGSMGLAISIPIAFITVTWLRADYISQNVSPFVVAALVTAGLCVLMTAASFAPAREARRTQPALLLREG